MGLEFLTLKLTKFEQICKQIVKREREGEGERDLGPDSGSVRLDRILDPAAFGYLTHFCTCPNLNIQNNHERNKKDKGLCPK